MARAKATTKRKSTPKNMSKEKSPPPPNPPRGEAVRFMARVRTKSGKPAILNPTAGYLATIVGRPIILTMSTDRGAERISGRVKEADESGFVLMTGEPAAPPLRVELERVILVEQTWDELLATPL